MKIFLILLTLILAILFSCSEVNENIGTNNRHYEDNASNVANTISNLSPGIYTINVFGKINSVTIFNIKAAMINNPNAKISLDLSNTTGLLGIDNEAFMGCNNLINIVIPNNAAYIANHAFSCCNNLVNITIPDSVTNIGYCAFDSCNSLTNIIIPSSVTSIGSNAFSYCKNLTNISIPDSVTSIGDYVFEYCGNLENVIIGSGVTTIGTNAFNECNNLKSVTFENTNDWYHSDNQDYTALTPINVTNESNNAVYLRNIYPNYWYRKTTITTTANNIENIIPKHSIGIYAICINGEINAFTLYNIKTIIIDNSNTQISLDLSNTTGLKEINNDAFSECNNLTNIILPNSVTYIGDSAFSGCSSLKSITIPNNVTSIDDCAFFNCNSLECIIIPNSVTTIDNYAFSGCSNLESVTIGSGVTTIGTNAFNECNNLTSVTFENTTDWYHSDNEDYTDSTLIDVTNKSDNAAYLRSIYPNYWCRKNTINTTTNDIENAISELPAGLYTINTSDKITPVTIFNIKSSMINNTNAQISLDLSNTTGLQEIDNEAFSGCYNLTNIILPNSVTTIGDSAFHNCYNLKSIIIPYSVTSIGDYAFNECNKLTSVNYTGTEEQWNQINIGDSNEYLTNATINYEYTDK